MENMLNSKKMMFASLGIKEIPSNIDMFYDLSYQLSTYIFDYRINHKLTQKGLASLLGVKQSMVSKLESGNYNISLENICNVMAKLDTKVQLSLFESPSVSTEDPIGVEENESTLINKKDLEELGVAS